MQVKYWLSTQLEQHALVSLLADTWKNVSYVLKTHPWAAETYENLKIRLGDSTAY